MHKSLFASLSVIVLIAIAFGSATTQTPSKRPELAGTLNLLCTPQIVWCEGMKAEFQKVYPQVTVEFVRLSSGEALTRLRNEKANPQFDIWWGGPIDAFIAAKAEGLLEAYNSPNLANLLDPKLMQDPDKCWAGIYVGSLGFASNKTFLEKHKLQPPQSWDGLLNPAFKGQLVMAHPASSGTAYTALITVLQLKGDVVLDRHTTCKVIQPIVDGSEKRAFWTNIVRAFLNKKACQAEVESFWNSVMFYNYVQESVGKGPRQPPAPAMWTRAEPAFLEILRCHEPACVVVLGRRPWTCLPHRGIAGPQLHLGPFTKDTRVYPTTDGHTALASWIKHPSSGFDPGEQHHWVAALLDAARRQQSHENITMLRFGTRPVEEPIPLECVCDRCGKKITPDDYIEWEEKYVLRFTAGYGSVFGDGAQVACDLCQACLYELIGPFCRRV